MTETDGRRWLTNTLRSTGFLVQRIESPDTGLGIPDLFMRTTSRDAWVELKCLRRVSGNIVKVPFRPRQYEWLTRYHTLGGLALLLLFFEDDFEERWLLAFKNEQIKREYEYATYVEEASLLKQLDEVNLTRDLLPLFA